MAKVVIDPKHLPNRALAIPGAKPSVSVLPYRDLQHPEEADELRELVRELRRRSPIKPQ